MTSLVWDSAQSEAYESGVHRGVIYSDSAEAWPGLVEIKEDSVGGETTPRYLDGSKFLNSSAPSSFQATVKAFSSPEGFSKHGGDKSVVPGLILTKQPRRRFHFSYQTLIGDGVGVKIHLVYNVLATPVTRTNMSMGRGVSPALLEWKFDAAPVRFPGFRPTAHFELDSTRIPSIQFDLLEQMLYGTPTSSPEFPSVEDLELLLSG